MTPPPVDVVCGIAAGGMAVGQLVYDNWDTISDFTSDAVDAVGDVASDAVDAVGDVAGDAVDAVGDVAEKVWPF
jgi:phage-related minor tail protein